MCKIGSDLVVVERCSQTDMADERMTDEQISVVEQMTNECRANAANLVSVKWHSWTNLSSSRTERIEPDGGKGNYHFVYQPMIRETMQAFKVFESLKCFIN